MPTEGSTSNWPSEDQAFVRAATELLKAGEYERLAELLNSARAACDQDRDAIPAQTLDLASRICLACGQSQAEAEWHQQAREEAAQREDQLRHQLDALLHLNGDEEWCPAESARSMRVESPSLWQRIQGMLRRQPETQSVAAAPETPAQSAEALVLSSPEPEPEAVAASPVEPASREEKAFPSLVVYCLGPFRVYQDDHLVTDWESLKARCILKYLVVHRGTPIVKDALMDAFWPDAEPEAARRNLHQAVYSLRKTLRQRRPDFPYVCFESDCYLLNPDTSAWLDFEQFEQHYRDGQRLEAAGQLAEAIEKYGIAEGLYQGDFLEEDLYEDWPTPQRQHYRTLYLQMADRLSEYYVRHGDLAAAIVLCRKILSLDSCYEEAHCRLMRCYLAQGQRHLAVRQYQICEQALREELDLAPSEETVRLYSRLTITA